MPLRKYIINVAFCKTVALPMGDSQETYKLPLYCFLTPQLV